MDLVPVDHDPFANAPQPVVPDGVTLQPVDHDPWAPYVNPATGRPEISVSKAPAEGVVAKSGQTVAQPSVAEQVAGFPQRAADMTIGALGPIGEAGMTVGDMLRTGHVDPRDIPQVAGGVMLGVAAPEAEEAAPLEAGAEAVAKGITAYHGSPYDFDKFDLSKIGTGEGAQAYGHGLYFAENPATAHAYKEALGGPEYLINGNPPADNIEATAARYLASSRSPTASDRYQDAMMALDLNDSHFAKVQRGLPPDVSSAVRQQVQQFRDADITNAGGKTYQVSINADPERFLDWDKPMSEQSPSVRQAFLDNLTRRKWPEDKIEDVLSVNTNGQQALNYIMPSGDKSQATEVLRQAGIPGIKYLDQGSRGPPVQILSPKDTVHGQWLVKQMPNGQVYYRGADEAAARAAYESAPKPTSNYVVFDDKIIDIIKKYGLAGLIAGGASHFATQPVDHDPFAARSQ
jgi:hypothetical protein